MDEESRLPRCKLIPGEIHFAACMFSVVANRGDQIMDQFRHFHRTRAEAAPVRVIHFKNLDQLQYAKRHQLLKVVFDLTLQQSSRDQDSQFHVDREGIFGQVGTR